MPVKAEVLAKILSFIKLALLKYKATRFEGLSKEVSIKDGKGQSLYYY